MKEKRIVQIDGGLGNQMFQYALALRLREEGYDVYLDYKKNELETYFIIDIPQADQKLIHDLDDCSPNIISRIRRKILGTKKLFIKTRR